MIQRIRNKWRNAADNADRPLHVRIIEAATCFSLAGMTLSALPDAPRIAPELFPGSANIFIVAVALFVARLCSFMVVLGLSTLFEPHSQYARDVLRTWGEASCRRRRISYNAWEDLQYGLLRPLSIIWYIVCYVPEMVEISRSAHGCRLPGETYGSKPVTVGRRGLRDLQMAYDRRQSESSSAGARA
ncbi:hypothetical protein CIB48_g8456 [Xylaria polymorpha]|nr:hypothetical protein CIB48_g8456 [Xylaria polymorpha]